MTIPVQASGCVGCYHQLFVQVPNDHLFIVLGQAFMFACAIYFVAINILLYDPSPSWFPGVWACWVLGRIMLSERTFSALTLLYDYHVRTRVCGIHWPKERDVPRFLCICCFLGIILWYHSGSEEPSTWIIIGCILGMLVVFQVTCYDSFKGLQAWKTTNKNFKRLQLVKVKSSQKIVVLFSSNASNQFRSNSNDVKPADDYQAVTSADLTDAQDFMQRHINSNANHPWIQKRRAIIECITGTIKGFEPQTAWEWIIWIPSSIWNWFPSPKDLKGAFRGPSWYMTCVWCLLLLPCGYGCLHWYPHSIQSWQSPNQHAWCNSDWYQNQCKDTAGNSVDSKEFFHAEMKRFGFIPGEGDTVFYCAWIVKHFSPWYVPTVLWFSVYLGLPFGLFIHNYCCEKPA